MRWQDKERSKNVEDRRGGGGGARVGAGIGIGTIVLLILAFFLGGDPGQILNQVQQQQAFLAGVWAHHMYQMDQNILERGDIEEAMAAAAAVGDQGDTFDAMNL